MRFLLADPEVASIVDDWVSSQLCRRLWEADHTLWAPEPAPDITNRLGWLDLPRAMRAEVENLEAFAAEVRDDGYDRALVLGMGGSSLAPEVFAATFDGPMELLVLDSTHPAAVAAASDFAASGTTLFVAASKSGTTIEPLSFLEHFWEETGGDGSAFVAITDPGTPLETLAAERGFRQAFIADPNVGGRYSALSHFGLVPAALRGLPLADLLDRAGVMRAEAAACGRDSAPLLLGAALAAHSAVGRDKATFFASPRLAAFPAWIEQLIAESTGKGGRGIVPVVDEGRHEPGHYGEDRLFIYLALDGDPDADTAARLDDLAAAGHPVIRIKVWGADHIGALMYQFELAVAAASSALGIHPFDQPDVQAAKALALAAMEGSEPPDAPLTPLEDGATAVADLLDGVAAPDYVGILAFVEPKASRESLARLRDVVGVTTGCATTLGIGPRYLHSSGQLHKGGPDSGVFIHLVDEPASDLAVPGKEYTFGELIRAQALGDHAALRAAGRRVISIDLGADAPVAIDSIAAALAS